MPREDLIAFADTETTGSDLNSENLIEIGIALYSWPAFEEIDSFSSLITPSVEAWAHVDTNAIVQKMHKENGLYDEIEALLAAPILASTFKPAIIDAEIDAWLEPYGSSHIPIGGSGFSHFDRPFVRKFLPRFDKRLTYWHLDIGVLRRMYLLAGAPIAPQDGMTHRALDDARTHASEFAYYMSDIRRFYLTGAPDVPVVEDAFEGIGIS